MAEIRKGLLAPLLTKLAFGRPFSLRNSFLSSRNWSYPLNKLTSCESDWLGSFVEKKISVDTLSDVVLLHSKEKYSSNNQYISFEPFCEVEVHPLLRNIAKVFKPADSIIGFGAYGSVADDTWLKGSSDLDLIVVLDLVRIESRQDFIDLFEIIVEANRQVLCHDPLQHHGITIVISGDVWPENLVPVEILQETKWYMTKSSVFRFQVPENKFSYSTSLKSSIKSHINKLLSLPFSLFNMYLAKVIFSSVLMLLVFLQEQRFQKKKSKKDHLRIISEGASTIELEILKYATEFRNTLDYPLTRVAASRFVQGNIVRLQLYVMIESFTVGSWSNKYKFELVIKKKLKNLLNEL